MAQASSSVVDTEHADTESCRPLPVGRPSRVPNALSDVLVKYTSTVGKSLCCVCAGDTHRLLLSWHSLVQSKKAGYLECVNNSIPGGVVAIEPTCCERIVEQIAGAAYYVLQRRQKLVGWARVNFYNGTTSIEVKCTCKMCMRNSFITYTI